jgi:putative hemolysin
MAPTEEWSALQRGFASITLDVAVRPHSRPEGSIISGSKSRCRRNVSGRTPVYCSQRGGNAGFVGEKAGGGVLLLTRPNLDDNAPAVYITELTQAFP